jgi:hypothetical protein
MTYSMSFGQRALAAALVLSAAALPAAAQQVQQPQDASAEPVQVANSMTVTRDADTGQLRAATAAEQAAMSSQKARSLMRVAAPRNLPKVHASGARGVRVTDDFFTGSSLIAVRQPDGSVKLEHGDATGAAAGQADVSTHTSTNPVTE